MTTLKYKIENSGVVTRERAIEIDGETGTLSQLLVLWLRCCPTVTMVER
jgi:hypothetical protein